MTPAGGDLHYVVRGPLDGAPPVVLLHGLGSSAADWEPQLASFEQFPLIAVDLPGHGGTVPTRGRMRIETMARAVERVLDDLRVPAAHVIGVSLGGCVALALALSAPARVRSLTIVNGFAKLTASGWRRRIRMLWRVALVLTAPMDVVAAHVARGLFPSAEQDALRRAAVARLSRTSRRGYRGAMLALATFDCHDRLTAIRCPTLVIAGARDETVPLRAKQELCAGIGGARLVVLADCGHAAHFEQPDAFNRAVLDFLTSH